AVNSHAHPKSRMTLQFLANFQRAQNWRFRTVSKNERATMAGRQPRQLPFCFSQADLLGSAHDCPQRLNLLALLVNEQLRVADNVEKREMADLQFYACPGRYGIRSIQKLRFCDSISAQPLSGPTV